MNFKMTVEQCGVSQSVEHNNLPEDTTVSELLEIFLKGLNNCGYSVDMEAINNILNAHADLIHYRLASMYH